MEFNYCSDCNLQIMEISDFLFIKIDGGQDPGPKSKISARLL